MSDFEFMGEVPVRVSRDLQGAGFEARAVSSDFCAMGSPVGITIAESDGTGTTLSHIAPDGTVQTQQLDGITRNIQLREAGGDVIFTGISLAGGLQFAKVTPGGISAAQPVGGSFASRATEYALKFDEEGKALLVGRSENTLFAAAEGADGSLQERVLSTTLDKTRSSLVQVAASSAEPGTRAAVWFDRDGTLKGADFTDLTVLPEVRNLPMPLLGALSGSPAGLTLAYNGKKAVVHAAWKSGLNYSISRWDDALNPNSGFPTTYTLTDPAPGSLQMVSERQGGASLLWRDGVSGAVKTASIVPGAGMSTPQEVVSAPVSQANLVRNDKGDSLITILDKLGCASILVRAENDHTWNKLTGLDDKPVQAVVGHVDPMRNYTVAVRHAEMLKVYTQSNS